MTDKPKRPRDTNQLSKFIADLATGEVTEKKKARSLGGKGGKRRSEVLTSERKTEIAKRAAQARWEGHPAPSEEE